jgi:hypothetical protein
MAALAAERYLSEREMIQEFHELPTLEEVK